MEQKEELVIGFSIWLKMKNMSLRLNNKQEYTIKDVTRILEISREHPQFNQLLKVLEENKVINIIKIYGKTKIFTVNIDKLDDMIENNSIWEEFAEYVHHKKLFYADI